MGQTVFIVTPLHNGNLACLGDQITFECETRGSSIISWASDEYIGQGDTLLQFSSADPAEMRRLDGIGDTVAILTANRIENGVQVLVSTLHVTATSMYPNPSVICIHGDESRSKANFSVIGKHNYYSILCIFSSFLSHIQICQIWEERGKGSGEGVDFSPFSPSVIIYTPLKGPISTIALVLQPMCCHSHGPCHARPVA